MRSWPLAVLNASGYLRAGPARILLAADASPAPRPPLPANAPPRRCGAATLRSWKELRAEDDPEFRPLLFGDTSHRDRAARAVARPEGIATPPTPGAHGRCDIPQGPGQPVRLRMRRDDRASD